jgi:hypothetical protein
MPDPVPNPVASEISSPPPSLAQQNALANGPANAPTPPPVNMPQQGPMPAVPAAPQPQVKGPSPWQRAVHALLGSQTEYNQTPDGPVPVQVENKPGQLFRSILAGAILGAGAGTSNAEHSAGSGWNAAGQGAAAAYKGQQQQQQQRAAQAQKQFENQRQVSQDNQEELVRKAQIAEANAQTLRINKEVQGMDYDQHQKAAVFGKASVKPYEDAGISPVASGLTESQMNQYLQDHPGSTSYDWEPVDVKTVLAKDANGNEVPSYEMVYSAYDPKGRVTIPESTVAEWKKAGVFDRYPEYATVLANNKNLPASTYIQVKRDAEKVVADNMAKQKQNQTDQLDQLKIDEAKAMIAEHRATTAHENLETGQLAEKKKQEDRETTAWDDLAKAGNDPSKISAEDRVVLAKAAQPAMTEVLNGIKAATNDPSVTEAERGDMWSQYHSLETLANLGGGTTPPPGDIPPGALIAVNPQTGEKRYSTDQGKTWQTAGAGKNPPAAPPPTNPAVDKVKAVNDAIGRAVEGVAEPTATAIKNYLGRELNGLLGGPTPGGTGPKEAP